MPYRFELAVVEQVGLVDDQDRGAAAFGGLAGEHVAGLGGEGGGAVGGLAAEAGDDVVVDAAHSGGGVADVDDGVPGRVECRRGRRGLRLSCRCRPRP